MTSNRPITLAEAAELCGLSAATLRRQAGANKLRAWKAGPAQRGVWMTTAADLENYLAAYGRTDVARWQQQREGQGR